jgi:hypothetical protein
LEAILKFQKIILDQIMKKFGIAMSPIYEGTSGMQDPRLARWWQIAPSGKPWNDWEMDQMMTLLRALPQVETAYPAPARSVPRSIPPIQLLKADPNGADLEKRQGVIPTPDFTSQQAYFLPAAQGGLDIAFAQTQPGSLGDQITVFDIEFDWNRAHEDLTINFPTIQGGDFNGTGVDADSFRAHGTAVAGIVGGDDNVFGVKGIAPNASFQAIRAQTVQQSNVVPWAIMSAADRGNPGDIILLEQQYGWSAQGERLSPLRYVPVEWYPAEFDAITSATRRGFVVIEAAANGLINQTQVLDNIPNGQNLDDPIFISSRTQTGQLSTLGRNPGPNPFDPTVASSGAVLVGAGAGRLGRNSTVDRARLDFSSYGARLDVQAWGENVATTGGLVVSDPSYCELNVTGIVDTNRCYTNSFSGTSSASAIIAGIAASVQGILRGQGLKPLTPQQFIQLFRDPNSGFPQNNGDVAHPAAQRIGGRPDMSRLIPKAIQLSFPAPNTAEQAKKASEK